MKPATDAMSCTRPPRCTKAPSAARSTTTRAIKSCPPEAAEAAEETVSHGAPEHRSRTESRSTGGPRSGPPRAKRRSRETSQCRCFSCGLFSAPALRARRLRRPVERLRVLGELCGRTVSAAPSLRVHPFPPSPSLPRHDQVFESHACLDAPPLLQDDAPKRQRGALVVRGVRLSCLDSRRRQVDVADQPLVQQRRRRLTAADG